MKEHKLLEWLKRRPLLLIVCALFVADALLLVVSFAQEREVLRVSFLHVGQGDAVFIEAPNGNQLLYDAGPPSGAVLRALGEVLPFWDRSIDVVLATHPDQDHVGGLPAAISRMHI